MKTPERKNVPLESTRDNNPGNSYTLSVPDGEVWLINAITVQYLADATAGSRRLKMQIKSGSNVLYEVSSGATHTASQQRWLNFMPGVERENAFTNSNDILIPIPSNFWVDGGDDIVIFDEQDVSASDWLKIARNVLRYAQ